jgi:hypothetical protein
VARKESLHVMLQLNFKEYKEKIMKAEREK